MNLRLSLAQREACEAVWRALDDRREIRLGLSYNKGKDDAKVMRRLVATTIAMLDEQQLYVLVKPEIEKYGHVRRDYVWRWSSVISDRDAAWPD